MGDSAGRFIGRFDSQKEFVPFVVFAGRRGPAAGEGLIEQLASEITLISIQRQFGRGPLLDPPICRR